MNFGMPDSAMLTLPDEPRILKFFAFSRMSSGRSSLSMMRVNVRFASRFETTMSAESSSPFSSTTPMALPSLTRTRSTPASVRILPPCSSSALAIDFEIAPMPPRASPQAPMLPSTSPMT